MSRKFEDFEIHIASDGRWFHQGDEIKRIAIVKLFASVLSLDNDGRYWLTTPAEKGEITVEDAPFIIVKLNVLDSDKKAKSKLEMVDNIERKFIVGPSHSIFLKQNRKKEQIPYLHLNEGLTAKISRPVYYELMNMVTQNANGEMGVWSAGEFIVLNQI